MLKQFFVSLFSKLSYLRQHKTQRKWKDFL